MSNQEGKNPQLNANKAVELVTAPLGLSDFIYS